jgi:hypothetical protein
MARKVDKKELSRDALLTIIACVAGVAAAIFELGWVSRLMLIAFAVGLTIFAARRHSAHPVLRTSVAAVVVALLLVFSARPIWLDFHRTFPNIVLRWPVSLSGGDELATREPPDLPPLDLPGAPLSKVGKVMYLCPMPPKVDAADRAVARAAFRKNADIYGRAFGVSIVINEIPYGIRLDITPNGAEGEARLAGVQRVTFQLETASRGLFVTVLMHMPAAMGLMESLGVDRDSDIEKLWKKQVEQLAGATEGTCRLL